MIFLKNTLSSAVAMVSITLLPAVAALTSCSSSADEKDSTVAARVGSSKLSFEEVEKSLPLGVSGEDSATMAEDYITRWIVDELVSEIAANNIHNLEEIDRMTADYRRNLIMEEYRRLKLEEDTSLAVSRQQIEEFYANYGGEMRLREPMVRGIFISVSSNSSQLPAIRRYYTSGKSDDIEKLEKVGLTEAVTYEYFRNRWMPVSTITDRIPGKPTVTYKGQKIDLTDGEMTYLLSVSDFLPSGASMPLSIAEPEIRKTLEQSRNREIDAQLNSQLYNKAIKDGKAWRHNPQTEQN